MKVSSELFEMAKVYLAMVDEPDSHIGTPERDAERTAAHELLMDEMELCNIPFNSRFEARWIARWIVAQHQPNFDSTPSLLWAKPNGDNEWFKEIRHVPPQDNKEGWIPVVVTFQPLSGQSPIFERNHLPQFEKGYGNYTEERHQWLDQLSLDTLIAQLHLRENEAADN